MEPPEMEPPAQRLQKYFEEQFKKFGKSPFAIPFAIGVSAAVYYLVMVYGGTICFIGLLTPLVLLGICWYFGIKSAKKLLIIGVLAMLVFAGVATATYANRYQHIQYKLATSDDKNTTLKDGGLQPLYGSKTMVYEFSVTVHVMDTNTTVREVDVLVYSISSLSSASLNLTMTEGARQVLNNTTGEANVHYVYNSTFPAPVNSYAFVANVSRTATTWQWYIALDHSTSTAGGLLGPMSKDTGAIMGTIFPIAVLQTLTSEFPVYLLLVVMVWWMRRTRKMRKDQMEKWEAERASRDAKTPKEDVKVSLQRRAMGLEDEGTFVCSECGADVPAAATVCPKCGEKFE